MKGISSCTGNIIVWNFFLYRILPSVQEISSRNKCLSTWKMTCCDTEFPPSSWDRKLPTVTRNFFLWQEISSYDKKFLPVTRNFFLWQDISSCDKKFLPVTRNFFLLQKIFLWQESASYETRKYLRSAEKHWFDRNFLLYFAWNTFLSNLWQIRVNFCQHFVWAWRFRGNLAPWFPWNIPPWGKVFLNF